MTDVVAAPASSGLVERLRAMDRVDLAAVVALVVQLVVLHEHPVPMIVVGAATVVILPNAILRRHPLAWLAMAAVVGAMLGPEFIELDDHVVAATYLVLAVGAALLTSDPSRSIAQSTKLVVGLIFAFALGWKIGAGQFVDGRFFHYHLLFDDRFELFRALTGDSASSLEANLEATAPRPDAAPWVTLADGVRTHLVAQVITWWTLLTEGAVAVLFLAPRRPRLEVARNVALLAFVLTTYVAVPVGGYATLLTGMGAIASDDNRWRVPFGAAFVGLALWAPVWQVFFG